MITSSQRNGKREAWDTVELNSCFELQNGVNFSAEQKGRGLLVVDVLNMYSDDLFVRTDRLYRVDIEVPDDRLLRPGDVLFVRSSVKQSGVGWPAIFKGHDEPVTNCGFLIRARQKQPKVEPKFFVHYLRQDHVRAQMISRAGKVAITNINQERLGSLKIPMPPLAEQRRIAEVLDRAEALRAKRRAALAQLDSLTQSIFLDLFGDTNDESNYHQRLLDDCAEVVSGVAKGRKLDGKKKIEVPYLRVANVQAGFLNLSEIKTIEALPSEVAELTLQPGDVVLTEGGDHDKLGRGAMWDGQIEGCIHQNHVFRVRPNKSLVLPRFFHEFLQMPAARAYFLRCAKRTTNLASINMTQLRALPIPLPPIPLQREFGRRVTAVEALKTAQRASLAELDALFATLQHRAFRGEL